MSLFAGYGLLQLSSLGRHRCSQDLIAADEKIRPKIGRRFRFIAAAFQRTFYGKLGGKEEGKGQGTAVCRVVQTSYRQIQGWSMYQNLAEPSTDNVCTKYSPNRTSCSIEGRPRILEGV